MFLKQYKYIRVLKINFQWHFLVFKQKVKSKNNFPLTILKNVRQLPIRKSRNDWLLEKRSDKWQGQSLNCDNVFFFSECDQFEKLNHQVVRSRLVNNNISPGWHFRFVKWDCFFLFFFSLSYRQFKCFCSSVK